MGRRSRSRRAAAPADPAPPAAVPADPTPPADRPAGPPASRRERTAQREAEARAALRPLAPGERPATLVVATVVALVLAGLVLAGFLTGTHLGGKKAGVGAFLMFEAILLAAAFGLWHARYWAVLGFQALLAFQVIIAALSLAVASNLLAVGLCLAIILGGGWLFWKLVRIMGRIQMPQRT